LPDSFFSLPCGLNGDVATGGRVGPFDPRTAGPNKKEYTFS